MYVMYVNVYVLISLNIDSVYWWILPLDVPGVLNCDGSVSLRGVDKPLTSKPDVSFKADLEKIHARYCHYHHRYGNHCHNDRSHLIGRQCIKIHDYHDSQITAKSLCECFMTIMENYRQNYCYWRGQNVKNHVKHKRQKWIKNPSTLLC